MKIIQDTEYDEETGRLISHAVGRCKCGRNVFLDAFTCPCDCGRDYNQSGDLLAPRKQWGEETGEHWSECF